MKWQPIKSAPKGKYVTLKAGKGTKEVHVPERVHTWRKDGHSTISYYIPDEDRWAGYTVEAGPDKWHPFPLPPKVKK